MAICCSRVRASSRLDGDFDVLITGERGVETGRQGEVISNLHYMLAWIECS